MANLAQSNNPWDLQLAVLLSFVFKVTWAVKEGEQIYSIFKVKYLWWFLFTCLMKHSLFYDWYEWKAAVNLSPSNEPTPLLLLSQLQIFLQNVMKKSTGMLLIIIFHVGEVQLLACEQWNWVGPHLFIYNWLFTCETIEAVSHQYSEIYQVQAFRKEINE